MLSSFCCAKDCENWFRLTERTGQLCLFSCDAQCLSACDTQCLSVCDTQCLSPWDMQCLSAWDMQCLSVCDTQCLSVCDAQCLSPCDSQCSGMHSRAVMFLAVELSFASASESRCSFELNAMQHDVRFS